MLDLEYNTDEIRAIFINATPSFPHNILRKSPIILCTTNTLISHVNPDTL